MFSSPRLYNYQFIVLYDLDFYPFPLKACLFKKKKVYFVSFSKSGFYQNACQSILNFSNKYSQLRKGAKKLKVVLTCW